MSADAASGCWISREAVWRPGQSDTAREVCAQTPATVLDLGDGYEVVVCDRHLAALRAVEAGAQAGQEVGQ